MRQDSGWTVRCRGGKAVKPVAKPILPFHSAANLERRFGRYPHTWRWRVGVVTVKKRMDHILYSEELSCFDARVLPLGGSDHYPVVALFAAKPAPTR